MDFLQGLIIYVASDIKRHLIQGLSTRSLIISNMLVPNVQALRILIEQLV